MMGMQIRSLLAALAAASAVACGGGLEAGVGSGGSGFGLATGTVTGFGSIVVDGTPWDVRDARIETLIDPSHPPALAEAKLGQRVRIDFERAGIARTVRVEPNVIGRLDDDVSPGSTHLLVAGQSVRTNADPARGPVTLFAGYGSAADMKRGDVVEIHGSPHFEIIPPGRSPVYVLYASRIERRAALPGGLLRASGVVERLEGEWFVMGLLGVQLRAGTTILPAGRALANGQRVTVWGREPLAIGRTLNADFVRIEDPPPAAGAAEIAGFVSRFDPASLSFEVDGIAVDARAALIVPAALQLAESAYVIASGTFRADGALAATQVRIRRHAPTESAVELKGVVTRFAGASSFAVRGVTVDAGTATLNGCAHTPLADGLFVEVAGYVAGAVVKAISVTCTATPPPDATLTFRGTASHVDASGRSFVLSIAGAAARAVSWTDTTLFVDVTPATLAGRVVEVEGFIRQGVLIATSIRPG